MHFVILPRRLYLLVTRTCIARRFSIRTILRIATMVVKVGSLGTIAPHRYGLTKSLPL
jgi:hypothetical protein